MNQTNVLLVEDDRLIVENLAEYLKGEGFRITAANGQKKALTLLETKKFDLILLDVTLSDGNGYSLCRAVKEKYAVPVIFLTALDDEFSVVTGLDMGAEDYISKPFRPRELVSRMRNVLRRNGNHTTVLTAGDIRIDTVKGIVIQNGTEIFLSALEYRLLLIFFQHKGMVLTRTTLLEEIWDIAGEYVNDNTLTVYIKRLREKIEENPSEPKLIRTIRGMGYKLEG